MVSKLNMAKKQQSSRPFVCSFPWAGQHALIFISLDGLLSASFLMLTLVAPLQLSPTRQRIQIYLWSSIIFVLFSILISFFKVKNRGAIHLYIYNLI